MGILGRLLTFTEQLSVVDGVAVVGLARLGCMSDDIHHDPLCAVAG
jgi:hypothetical protein